jgi:hypothetical protein
MYLPITDRLRQGDLYREICVARETKESDPDEVGASRIEITDVVLGYGFLITQDCDLEWDHRLRYKAAAKAVHDKLLDTVLLCPAYPAQRLREGTHLSEIEVNEKGEEQVAKKVDMQKFNSDMWSNLRKNMYERYHYLPGNDALHIPELALDFKRYQTVKREALIDCRAAKRGLGTLDLLFREDLSVRFANYLSRIGLPELATPAEGAEPIPGAPAQ